MFVQYGDEEQYFVSQCVNFQYVIIGGVALLIIYRQGQITIEMIQIDHRKFIIMGFLDCFAGFLAACGAKYTNGGVQQLLNQSLIPLTMLASYIFLKKSSTYKQIIGSVIIFLGVFIVILPNIVSNSNMGSPVSSLIYASSNIPYALSFCYKEYGFKNLSIHVIYLTQLVSVYQFFIGFLLAPLMAKVDGRTLQQTAHSFATGFNCFIGVENDVCQGKNSFYYLTGYCIVNFTFNTLGLYLVKHSSATLNSISYAIILPITTLAFTCPLLGRYREKFNINILEGLIVVMIGFLIWKLDVSESNGKTSKLDKMGTVVTVPSEPVITFNERTIVPIMIKKKNIK